MYHKNKLSEQYRMLTHSLELVFLTPILIFVTECTVVWLPLRFFADPEKGGRRRKDKFL